MFLMDFIGPIMGRWNRYLEHKFPLRSQAGKSTVSFTALSKRVVADQLVMAPIGVRPPHWNVLVQTLTFTCLEFQLSIFLSSMAVMEGRDAQHIRARFNDIYFQALLANWKVWPTAQVRFSSSCFHMSTWLTRDVIVYQFPLHALTVSCPVPTNVRRFLDTLPVPSQLSVCILLFRMLTNPELTSYRESEKQDVEDSLLHTLEQQTAVDTSDIGTKKKPVKR
jgi:hypothetical protein